MGKLTNIIFIAGIVMSGYLPVAMAQSGALHMEMEKKGAEMGIQKMDADHDGMISRKEYMQAHEKIFEQMDQDADGQLKSSDIVRMDSCMMHGMPQGGMTKHDKVNGRGTEGTTDPDHTHDGSDSSNSSSANYPHALTH